jgi:BirA family transcriptional regulator, biotin operon repressor / biotin---[acetyl-CoA-carboxylase] ligase
MELDPAAAAAGVRLIVHDSIGSTNAEALLEARLGERGPLWVTAAQQTAGRGRRGRPFVSERGNLYASLLLTDPSSADRAAELSFVAALALHDAVCELAATLASRIRFKWPNDLICDGAKFAGILVEGESASGRPLAAVVGIGVNCANHPAGMAYPATDLAAAGANVSPETLFRTLSGTVRLRLAEWDRGRGFAAIRTAWLARAIGLGDVIRVSLPDRELQGRFESLDDAGRLLLRHETGALETITAGDIFPLSFLEPGAAVPRVAPLRESAPATGKGLRRASLRQTGGEGRD